MNIIESIKRIINNNRELNAQKSWIKYLESEVDYLNRHIIAINQSNIRNIDELVKENEFLSGANAALTKEIGFARNLAARQRDMVFARAATPAEHRFLNVCAAIYDSGKVIKGRTFTRMMRVALGERRSAVANRFGGNNEISELWGERVSPKGNKAA